MGKRVRLIRRYRHIPPNLAQVYWGTDDVLPSLWVLNASSISVTSTSARGHRVGYVSTHIQFVASVLSRVFYICGRKLKLFTLGLTATVPDNLTSWRSRKSVREIFILSIQFRPRTRTSRVHYDIIHLPSAFGVQIFRRPLPIAPSDLALDGIL